MIQQLMADIFAETERETLAHLQINSSTPNRKLMTICITVALSLSLIHYGGNPSNIATLIGYFSEPINSANYLQLFYHSPHARLLQLSHWIFFTILGYAIIPLLVIRLYLKEEIKTFGFSGSITRKDLKIYGLMLVFMIPLVIGMSFTASCQHKYPFYHETRQLPDIQLFIWEAEYMLQFFALEFFFRGFFLHGIKDRFGFYSVFVMTIPYCMIHFGKPFPETMAAIIAGIALGILSLKSKNIWLGFFIHCSVALTMDFCSLWQQGLLATS